MAEYVKLAYASGGSLALSPRVLSHHPTCRKEHPFVTHIAVSFAIVFVLISGVCEPAATAFYRPVRYNHFPDQCRTPRPSLAEKSQCTDLPNVRSSCSLKIQLQRHLNLAGGGTSAKSLAEAPAVHGDVR